MPTSATPSPIPIVVLAFNKHEETQRCIDSIHQNTAHPFRIILVDNGSTPAYPESEGYRLVRLPENLFYTRGVNAGIRDALRHFPDFSSIVLLNNDTVVTPGWLSNLAGSHHPEAGVIGNKHFLLNNPDEVIHAGTADLIGGTHKGGPDAHLFNEVTEEIWVTFACVLIKRRCLEAVGLLDERMQHYYSDNDFCLRTWLAGFKVVFEPDSNILHSHNLTYGETSISVEPDQQVYIDKWLGKDLIEKIFNRIFLDAPRKQLVVLQRDIVSKATA